VRRLPFRSLGTAGIERGCDLAELHADAINNGMGKTLSAVGKAFDKRHLSLYNHFNNNAQGWP
jgi:hypothetical protein